MTVQRYNGQLRMIHLNYLIDLHLLKIMSKFTQLNE